jgi:hypothetical protein
MAEIVFDNDNRKRVLETVEEIHRAMRRVRTPHVPLVMLREQDGREVWVNAARILEIYETGVPQQRATPGA